MKSLQHLYIINFNKEKISVSAEVKKEIDRLLTEKLLHQSLNFPVDVCKDECLTILFLNIRSLYAHFQDIENDPNFTSADINIYSETKFSGKHDSKDFTLLGYDMHRYDCLLQTIATSAYGMAVYSKVQHKDQVIHTHREILPAVGVIVCHYQSPFMGSMCDWSVCFPKRKSTHTSWRGWRVAEGVRLSL